MSEENPTLDPIGYRCDGCGRLFRDPYADLSAIRAAGGRSCCPERKPVGLSDRIEELEAKLDRYNDLVADKINLRSENAELKAKLAKAELIIRIIASDKWDERLGEVVDLSCEYLAEMTGGKDE